MFFGKKWTKEWWSELGVHDTLITTKNLIHFYIQKKFKPRFYDQNQKTYSIK